MEHSVTPFLKSEPLWEFIAPHQQKEIVDKLQMEDPQHGQPWFLLSMKWWEQWTLYTTNVSSSPPGRFELEQKELNTWNRQCRQQFASERWQKIERRFD